MKNFNINQKAFSMLELVMVIVVLGVLGSLAMPRLDRDMRQELADNILADIRYTQHLALMDYRHNNSNSNWQKSFWTIGFARCTPATDNNYYEYIGSDTDYSGGINSSEALLDPTNGKKMSWSSQNCDNGGDIDTSDRIFLTYKFGVKDITFTGSGNNSCSTAKYIGFDHLGRPHKGFKTSITPNYASYLNRECKITFTLSNDDTFSIIIEPETGYAQIEGEENS